jgi:GNAT superfamily N-acetyltransferase
VAVDIARSALDERRWGVKTARATITDDRDLDHANRFCELHGVSFLILRVSTSKLQLVREIERQGGFLTDTLLWFRRDMTQPLPALERPGVRVRPLKPGETDDVLSIAEASFQGYMGHYHADPRLDRAECDDLYSDWARRGCEDKKVADAVLVAESEGRLDGFALLKVHQAIHGDVTLSGVHPRARRRGIYAALMVAALRWASDQHLRSMMSSTQVTNHASQRLWADLGFRIDSSLYTLHRWFE